MSVVKIVEEFQTNLILACITLMTFFQNYFLLLILACIILMLLYSATFDIVLGEVSLLVELLMMLYGFLWITVKVRYVIVLAFQDVCSVVKNQYSVIPLLCIRILDS